MLIIGELINTSRKAVKPAVEQRDVAFIQELAKKQVESGAHFVDVNCGTLVHDEVETMEWLVQTIQAAVSAPLCIDTPRTEGREAGLAAIKNGQPMVNSITAESERFAKVQPLVLKYKAKVVPCAWMIRVSQNRESNGLRSCVL